MDYRPLCLAFLSLSACQESAPTDLHHTLGEPIRSRERFQWTELSENELTSHVLPRFSGTVVEPPQAIAEAFAALATATQAFAGVSHIPVPKLYFIESNEINAWAASLPVCYKEFIYFPGAGTAVVERASFSKDFQWETHGTSCVERNVSSLEERSALVKYLQALSPDCTYEARQDGIYLTSACKKAPPFEKYGSAQSVVLPAQVPVVAMTSGLAATYSPEALRFIMAHELAHYYRAHAAPKKYDYNYFYKESERLRGKRPEYMQNLQKNGEEFLRFNRWKPGVKLSNQTLQTNVMSDVIAYGIGKKALDQLCKEGSCTPSCRSFVNPANASEIHAAFGQVFRGFAPSQELLKAYLVHEQSFFTCGATVSLNTVVQGKTVREFLQQHITQVWPNTFPKELGETVPSLLAEAPTLADLASSLSQHLRKMEEKKAVLEREFSSGEWGFYTDEQEADALAIELLARQNWSLTAVTAALRKNLELIAATTPKEVGKIHPQECLKLQENAWKTPDGQRVIIPVEDWRSPYHSECYRLYHAESERAAHGL